MQDVLKTLKQEHEETTGAFFMQGNTGCYHSAYTTGVQALQIDGKDAAEQTCGNM